MHVAGRRAVVGALVAAATIAWGAAHADPARPRQLSQASHGQVFMFSGLLGEALSPGLESFADKIRARGIPVTLSSHGSAAARAEDAEAAYRSGNHGAIVLVGHSLGAEATMQMAGALNDKKIPVRLIVSIGPTADLEAPANVAAVINYYQSASLSKGKAKGGAGFRGSISNIDLENAGDINHFNIVQGSRLQTETVNRIASLVSTRRDPQQSASHAAPAPAAAPAQHGVN